MIGVTCGATGGRSRRPLGSGFGTVTSPRHSSLAPIGVTILALALGGCAQTAPVTKRLTKSSTPTALSYDTKTGVYASPRIITAKRRVPKGGGNYKLGKPYKVSGRWYVPKLEPNYNRTGTASWYGDDFHGRKTANGEIYDMNALTAAHPTMPIPSYAYVTNLTNGRTVMVRVNDRGPYAHNRIIDMSRAAATALDYKGKGLTRVRVRYAGRAPLNGSDARERQFLSRQSWSRGLNRSVAVKRRPSSGRIQSRRTRRVASSGAREQSWNWRPGARQPAPRRAQYRQQPQSASRPAYSQNNFGQPVYGLGRTGSAVYVRAGTFRNLSNAQRLQARLSDLGAVHLQSVPLAQGHGYRVSIGPVGAARGQRLLSEVAARGADAPLLVSH